MDLASPIASKHPSVATTGIVQTLLCWIVGKVGRLFYLANPVLCRNNGLD